MVVPITSVRRGLPSHVEIDAGDSGLDDVSYAMCEDLKSVSDRLLISRLGAADVEAVFEMERAIRFLLDL